MYFFTIKGIIFHSLVDRKKYAINILLCIKKEKENIPYNNYKKILHGVRYEIIVVLFKDSLYMFKSILNESCKHWKIRLVDDVVAKNLYRKTLSTIIGYKWKIVNNLNILYCQLCLIRNIG